MTRTATLTDFDQLDIAEAIRNAAAHDASELTARDRRALTLLTYVPGLHGGTRALAHVLAENRVALPLPTDLAMALLDVLGNDDLLGPEPEWDVQEAWLAARESADDRKPVADEPAEIPAERTRPGKAFQVVNIFEIGTGRFIRQVRHHGTVEQARAYGLMGQLHDTDPMWHELRDIVNAK